MNGERRDRRMKSRQDVVRRSTMVPTKQVPSEAQAALLQSSSSKTGAETSEQYYDDRR